MRLSPRPLAAALAALSFVAVGCGESGGDPGADPAAVVPARAPVYLEGNLKPGDDIVELAKKLSGEEDPGGAIKRAIEKSARKNEPDFKFSEQIEPWLGDHVGVFVTKITLDGDPPVGLVAPTKDPDAAKKALEARVRSKDKDGEAPEVVERTHRDHDYIVDTSDDQAVAIVEDYAVFGNDEAIKAAIDAVEGDPLADNAEYKKARDAVEESDVGFAYLRLSQIFSGLGPQGTVVQQALSGVGDTIGVGLDGDESSIVVSSASLGVEKGSDVGGAREILESLPADAWAAFGVGDAGKRIEDAIKQFSQLGALGGQDIEQLLDQFETQFGFDPRRDLAAWLGDVGVFAIGDKPATIGGALVASTTDADAARRSIPRLAVFLERVAETKAKPVSRPGVDLGIELASPNLPIPVYVVLTDDDRFAIAATDAALDAVLKPAGKLGDSAEWKDATGRLGSGFEPAFFLNFEPLPGLLAASGQTSDPNVEKVQAALEHLTTLIAGSKHEDETLLGRLVVGVK